MMIKLTAGLLLVSPFLASAQPWDLAFPSNQQGEVKQFTCSIEGAAGQDACDDSKDDDGSGCVWCQLYTFGACVNEDQAEKMKQAIPGLQCDDDDSDDDNVPDDDAAPNDDDVPDDYWKCLKDYSDSDSCGDAGCAWCDTKAGYGICMDKEAAETASKSDWFDCKLSVQSPPRDPYDTSCLVATMQGDAASCEATTDQDGQGCEWCLVSSVNLCLNTEQAEIAEQIGGSCEDQVEKVEPEINDPYDTSCLVASLQGDASSCEATVDQDGQACQWCMVSSVNVCLNSEQAMMAEQVGGSCGEEIENDEPEANDPYDTSCLAATLQGDASSCEATKDQDGESCQWCLVSSVNVCLNGEQAMMAEQVGGSCDGHAEKVEPEIFDPYDTSCLVASLQGDEGACEATVDQDGQACQWCLVSGANVCLNADQAALAQQVGGECSSGIVAIE